MQPSGRRNKGGIICKTSSGAASSFILNQKNCDELVGVTGFEPATSWSQTTRSTKLSYTPLAAHMFIMSRRNTHAKVYDLTAALPISASIAPDEPTILKRKIFP